MSVQRYDSEGHYGSTFESDDGEFVKYEDYAALLKERDALAAENAGLRRFISGSCYVFDGDHDDDMPDEFVDASHYMPIVTPATDAAIANIQAQGVEKFADKCNQKCNEAIDNWIRVNWKLCSEHAVDFAAELGVKVHDTSN